MTTNEHTERAELISKLNAIVDKYFTREVNPYGSPPFEMYVTEEGEVLQNAGAMLEECCATTQAQRQALKPLTDKQIAAVAVDADCVWLQKEYTCSFRAIVRATEAAHGIKDTP